MSFIAENWSLISSFIGALLGALVVKKGNK